jgi:predicted RNase H-like HicB family nuclease
MELSGANWVGKRRAFYFDDFRQGKLLGAWKLLLSFTKRRWELSDYPVVIHEQTVERESGGSASRDVPPRYLARIVNWSGIAGFGESPEQAMADLVNSFARLKESWQRDGRPLPRPGTKVHLQFAPSNRVNAHPDLTRDFMHRILGLDWAFVSDQSSLWHFHGEDTNDVFNAKIREVYGVDVSDLKSGNLAEILERIAVRQTH